MRGPTQGGPFGGPRGDVAKVLPRRNHARGRLPDAGADASALETHGLVADWKPDMLTVWASTQGTSAVRSILAAVFNLKKSQIRVITEYMGGGFGAKFGPGNYGVLATHFQRSRRARAADARSPRGTPVVGNRPNSTQKIKVGAKRDGTLVAMHLAAYGTAGVGLGAGELGQRRIFTPAMRT